jgi:glycosyltransferase involved in cell wall biosynthesis
MIGVTPRYSIIIPTYNRRDAIRSTLESLRRLSPPPGGWEVIVVDDGSPTLLDALVEPFHAEFSIQLIRQTNAGPAAARNHGARLARGEFLAFTDDDCQPDPQWLCALDHEFQTHPGHLLGGLIVNGLRGNVCSTISQFIVDLVYAQFNPTPDKATFFCSNNFAMSARRFRELGGFDDRHFRLAGAEDRDFCARWRQRGWEMRQVNGAVIQHFHHMTLAKFWNQCFRYGRGAWTFHRLQKQRGVDSFRRDSELHRNLPHTLLPLWRRLGWKDRLATPPLLVVWQLANALGFVYQRWLDRRGAKSQVLSDDRPSLAKP